MDVVELPYHPLKDSNSVAPLTQHAYVFVTGRDSGVGSLHGLVAGVSAVHVPTVAEQGIAGLDFPI